MIKKIKITLLLSILTTIGFIGCKKDISIKNKDNKALTPYILERKSWYPQFNLPTDNPLTEEGVLLGRMLFYDPILSADSTQSCATCHRQNRAFTENRRFSKGITGAIGNRNSMPLYNLMWHKRFFWDGRVDNLKEQVLFPIQAHNEMNLNLYDAIERLQNSKRYFPMFQKVFGINSVKPIHLSKSLEQFLITLLSFNAPIDDYWGNFDSLKTVDIEAFRGMELFMKPIEDGGADCFHCHSNLPFFGTTSASGVMTNNGLDATFSDLGFGSVTARPDDFGKFKTPSLRNVAITGPYMHDGRFATLEEVIDFYSSGIKLNSPNLDVNILSHNAQMNLTAQQKSDLLKFLDMLTDRDLLTNPKYSDPFK